MRQQGLSEQEYHDVDVLEQRSRYSEREQLAIEFAERYAVDHVNMGEDFFARLRAVYADAEIVELAGTIAFCLGIGRVYRVLDIANECPVVH